MCIPRSRKSSMRYQRIESVESLPPRQAAIPIMGPPPRTPSAPVAGASTSHLSAQHERLILELLPFKEPAKFQEWLQSVFVRGAWIEFWQDFLSKAPASLGEPDKAKMAQSAKDAINSRSQKFMLYHPDKTDWTYEDHHVRFMVTLIQDNMLRSLWSESEWKKKAIEIAKAVYEVLCFLKATTYMAEQGPPSYSQ